MRIKTYNIAAIGLLFVVGIIIYNNVLCGEFIWDDYNLVRDNVYLRSWHNLGRLFTGDIGRGAGIDYHFYRPLQMVTYMVDYSLYRLRPVGYHLTNVILHILVAVSIYYFITAVFKDRLLGFFTGLLFLLHPIHTEAVAHVAGRADVLGALFMLLSFLCYLKDLERKSTVCSLMTIATYLLALLSKESCFILPFLVLMYHYAGVQRVERNRFLPLVLITLAYFLVRITLLRSLLIPSSTTLAERVPGSFAALATYLRLLLVPYGLHMEYGNAVFPLSHPRVIAGLIIAAAACWYLITRRWHNKLAFFSISWFFLALLPVWNIYPLNAYMAEHWLYVPSLGFFLLLAAGFRSLYARVPSKVLTVSLFISICLALAYLTMEQNTYWSGPLTFYQRTLRYAPGSGRVYNALGVAYQDAGKLSEAQAAFEKAISYNPHYAKPYNNLAYLHSITGKNEEAVTVYKKVIALSPGHADAYNNLGTVYAVLGNENEAGACFKKAIEVNPRFGEAHLNLSIYYLQQGNYGLAGEHYDKAEKYGVINARIAAILRKHTTEEKNP